MEHHVKEPNHDGKRKAFLSPPNQPFTTKMAEKPLMVFRYFYILSYKNSLFSVLWSARNPYICP